MEYIVKYAGRLPDLGFLTELLDARFAIMDLGSRNPMGLLDCRQVTCFEPTRPLSALESRPARTPVDYRSMEAACIPRVHREYGLTGQGVLIGFVDSGLDLNHPEFLGEDGRSRVTALWDMTAQGVPPEGFRKGALYSGEDIAAGRVLPGDRSGHGTAVAAIAAGRSGVAPGAAIAAVKLASAQSTDVMRAVKFLLDQGPAPSTSATAPTGAPTGGRPCLSPTSTSPPSGGAA